MAVLRTGTASRGGVNDPLLSPSSWKNPGHMGKRGQGYGSEDHLRNYLDRGEDWTERLSAVEG
jgi:hypothetical protein